MAGSSALDNYDMSVRINVAEEPAWRFLWFDNWYVSRCEYKLLLVLCLIMCKLPYSWGSVWLGLWSPRYWKGSQTWCYAPLSILLPGAWLAINFPLRRYWDNSLMTYVQRTTVNMITLFVTMRSKHGLKAYPMLNSLGVPKVLFLNDYCALQKETEVFIDGVAKLVLVGSMIRAVISLFHICWRQILFRSALNCTWSCSSAEASGSRIGKSKEYHTGLSYVCHWYMIFSARADIVMKNQLLSLWLCISDMIVVNSKEDSPAVTTSSTSAVDSTNGGIASTTEVCIPFNNVKHTILTCIMMLGDSRRWTNCKFLRDKWKPERWDRTTAREWWRHRLNHQSSDLSWPTRFNSFLRFLSNIAYEIYRRVHRVQSGRFRIGEQISLQFRFELQTHCLAQLSRVLGVGSRLGVWTTNPWKYG